MKKNITLLLFLLGSIFTSSAMAETTWIIKRELGGITIWKTLTLKGMRATSQWFDKPSTLALLKNKKKVVKDFEADKKKSLAHFGINQWHAQSYSWEEGKSLTVVGTYINREGLKVNFVEKHLFKKNSRGILLLVNEAEEKITQEQYKSFLDEVIKRQSL